MSFLSLSSGGQTVAGWTSPSEDGALPLLESDTFETKFEWTHEAGFRFSLDCRAFPTKNC